jgi:23S rRNA U2552 (ribose-2'-O)-methylase RlmE/FtsJ
MSFFQLPQLQYNQTFINTINPIFIDIDINIDYSGNNTNTNFAITNRTLCKYLADVKTQIDSKQDEWDKYKKYTNPYEFIHSIIPGTKQSVATCKPLSRSYYKMIEICKMMDLLEGMPEKMNSFHLAEGPGGFIEALALMRSQIKDNYYGMTLIDDDDRNVPGWRKTRQFLSNNPNVYIERGIDNRGDLMNPYNLQYCYEKYKNSMELITGDGGFDFSMDFNKQEIISSKLIFSQIAFAIAMQKYGGCFILKFFDTFTRISIDLLYMLTILYDKVYFVKPSTSRQANSEKYIVCKGFRLVNSGMFVSKFIHILDMINSSEYNKKHMISLINSELPYLFTNKIEEYNAIFGQQQIENIVNTLTLIDNNNIRPEKLEIMKKNNIQKCINWCQKYNIPCNKLINNSNIFLSCSKFRNIDISCNQEVSNSLSHSSSSDEAN